MMESMIERVACGIARCQAELGEEKWRYCLPEARAAIQAMRSVDPQAPAVVSVNWTLAPDQVERLFKQMIDAALNEQVSA
jgi:hypothetical protein